MLGMLASIGLVRYAYSPLVPAMIDQDWLSSSQVGYLGTVNFVGQLHRRLCLRSGSRDGSRAAVVCRVALLVGFISVGLSAIDFGIMVARRLSIHGWTHRRRWHDSHTGTGRPGDCGSQATRQVHQHRLRRQRSRASFILSLTLPSVIAGEDPTIGWLYTAGLTLDLPRDRLAGPQDDRSQQFTTAEEASSQTVYRGRLILLGITAISSQRRPSFRIRSIWRPTYTKSSSSRMSFSMMVYAIYGAGIMLGGPIDGRAREPFPGPVRLAHPLHGSRADSRLDGDLLTPASGWPSHPDSSSVSPRWATPRS